MLSKLALKNIRKSIKDYAIYFITLILGVAIFYVFNSIDSQVVMLNVSSSTKEIIQLMTNLLSGVSIFVSFILGFLIIYASRFLIKKRNKEFGIYLTLGMSKRKISLILFLETILVGVLSLIVGLGLGICLSQFMSILVANMFEADMTKFEFIFSSSACIKTLIYFSIMYLLVMIFNTVNISKCKLIDLLHANKKSEKLKLKNPLLCTIIFIISTIVLGYAYYQVTGGVYELQTTDEIFLPIILGATATFLIFWSLSGLLLKIVMSMKNLYYKGLNSFILRQVSSKINTTVFSMTVICLMLFVTICVFSSSLSLKNSMSSNLEKLVPRDVQLSKKWNLPDTSEHNQDVKSDSKVDVRETLVMNSFNIKKNLKDIIDVNTYSVNSLTWKETLGSSLSELKKQYPKVNYDTKEIIMKISDYNKVATSYGLKNYTLNVSEYIIVADFEPIADLRNISLSKKTPITINGQVLNPKYQKCKDGFIEMSSNHINAGIILVADDLVNDSMLDTNLLMANYRLDKKEVEKDLNQVIEKTWTTTSLTSINSKIAIAEAGIGLGALVTFIGLYLGIIFLISSAAILSLKELSESTDNKDRFKMLRKLGVEEKVLNKALFSQIGIFFIFPLLLASIHSFFGIKFVTYILETFGTEKLLPSVLMTALFIIMIYGGYFIVTYYVSKNIMKEK